MKNNSIKYLRILYRQMIQIEVFLIPKFFLDKVNPAISEIDKFIFFVSKQVKHYQKVLDAGAGKCPYKKYFVHTKYESTDIRVGFEGSIKGKHDFICNLENIPKSNNTYDVVICTQVLEHVEFPQEVINEFYRILRPGGKLFITAPQSESLHGAPYHFYNFTYFGLQSLFKIAGFKIIFINPRGGIFWQLGDLIRSFPTHILYQYLVKQDWLKGANKKTEFTPKFQLLLLLPFIILLQPLCRYIIPFIFYYLDVLDKEKIFTLGYNCYCIKQK